MKDFINLIDELIFLFQYPTKETLSYFNLNNNLQNIETEFVRLFINDFDEKVISLYAASYIKEHPVQNTLQHLNEIYSLSGIEINPEFNERSDHLTILLEFLALLISANLDKKFLKNFIKTYILCFKPIPELIKEKSSNKIYLITADKLNYFLNKLENFIENRN